jgi:arylsulfatase A-like enzyme
MKRLAIGIACVLVAGLAAGWVFRDEILMRVPGIIGHLLDPVGETREVVWEAGPAAAAAPPAARPPNVVVILADDLGYNDLTWNGGGVAGGSVPTPRIDSIARAGVDLSHGYTGNATCAPSRAAIMTGRYPTRFGFEFTPAPVAFMRMIAHFQQAQPGAVRAARYYADREDDVPPLEAQGMPPDEITLAELLAERGYHTIGLGKWHLGGVAGRTPETQGFDEFLGFRAGGGMYLDPDDPRAVNSIQDFDPIDRFLWANLVFAIQMNDEHRFEPSHYMTDYLSDEAVKAIEANRNRPFFMYLAYNAPHTPLQATREDYDALSHIENHTLRVYAAMIRALDRGVGRVLDALERNGLAENTLVIFTSDNGGANYIGLPDINAPYRGWKMTFFEGGIRTPFFVRWPARLPAGTRYDEPVAHIDVFATAAAAAGAPLPSDRVIDGVDLLPFLRGEVKTPPHQALFWRSGHYRVVLAGGWKLQVSEHPAKTWLFDVSSDPTEQRNLADERPDKRAELEAVLAAHTSEETAPAWPSLIEGPIAIDHSLAVADRPDDEHVYWAN